ncbi:uncharacterized protein EV420DRAFT_1548294 [Desarmillaria tabescens]|uniref:Mid2 domain-containing protein n=1 Tax=Armillaria tabescens TaxID=1929756 RepID=A0AA39KA84_ARMTA|nr:uncharacterized protein EV420DRAFT_1548294 [Desarmillaria tabescens]KAK0457446.1 hypothetical protein EV420DRAFT_1548294 [Desarmillaria tabescens]
MDALTFLLEILLVLSFMVPYLLAQDHTQCKDSSSDWYTSVVGETPCSTYERLRKLCNSNYVLGSLDPNNPPDTCDDEIAECCCNSISFGLSMLCLTCQQGRGPQGNGIDADTGTYQQYLMQHGSNSFCNPITNKSFTDNIQTAVCNNELKIHDDFYDGVFWNDGAWFYTWTRERMETTNAANANNSFTHCTSTTLNVTSVSESQSTMTSVTDSTATSASSASPSMQGEISKSLSAGAIAGIVVGSTVFIGLIALCFVWLLLHRRRPAVIENSETLSPPFLTESVTEDASVTAHRYGNSLYTLTNESSESQYLGEKVEKI